MAALDDLTFTYTPSRTWSASANKTGSTFQAIKNSGSLGDPTFTIKKTYANAAVGGGDMLVSAITSIAGAGAATIDLTALNDVLERSGGSFARLKYIEFMLLAAADDSQGTAASQVTIGNAATNANQLFLGGDTHTIVLKTGEFAIWGTRSAAGLTVDGTNKNILITNNDASVTAKVRVTLVGGTT